RAAGSDVAVVAAALCADGADCDSRSRHAAPHQAQLTQTRLASQQRNSVKKAICRNFRQLAGNELGGSCKPARKREPISESARGPPGRPAVDPGRLSRFQEAATRLRA